MSGPRRIVISGCSGGGKSTLLAALTTKGFATMLEGKAVLVTDAGRETLRAGESVGFAAGVPDGHHLINESDRDVVFLVVGARNDKDGCDYPDIDMKAQPGRYTRMTGIFTKKDDTPY